MLQALQAYQQQDFATADSKFTELLPLGNEVASFNLAAMALNGGRPTEKHQQSADLSDVGGRVKASASRSLIAKTIS